MCGAEHSTLCTQLVTTICPRPVTRNQINETAGADLVGALLSSCARSCLPLNGPCMATVAPSVGQSKSSKQTRSRALQLFDEFRNSTPERLEQLPDPFDALGADALLSQATHGGFALFMIDEVIIPKGQRNAGKNYAHGTALDYMGAFLNLCDAKCKPTASPAGLQFLACLDSRSTSDSAKWWRGVKNYVIRTGFMRMRDAGEEMDKSAAPLSLPHVQAMCRSLALEGSAQVCHLLRARCLPTRAPASVPMSA